MGSDLEMIEGLPKFPKKLRELKPHQGFLEDSQYKILSENAGELWLQTFLTIGIS